MWKWHKELDGAGWSPGVWGRQHPGLSHLKHHIPRRITAPHEGLLGVAFVAAGLEV